MDWRIGAEYFESVLLDYDVCSNYGNWNYVAGVGCDPREGRYFNILKQARMYDPHGEYMKHWLPELAPNYAKGYYPKIVPLKFANDYNNQSNSNGSNSNNNYGNGNDNDNNEKKMMNRKQSSRPTKFQREMMRKNKRNDENE